MGINHLQHTWMLGGRLPCREERRRKNLWTTSCFRKFLCSSRFPEFMYFTSCSEAFRKMSVSLTGPSPLFSPAKQAGDASEDKDHSCGRLQKLPRFSSLSVDTLALPGDFGSPSIKKWDLFSSSPGPASGLGMTDRRESWDFCSCSEVEPQEAWLSSTHSLETLAYAMCTGPVSTSGGQETA